MAILVSAHQLSKTFSSRPLFQDLTLTIETGDRIGLIGPNGAGKSTLLRILASQIQADSGTLSLQRGLTVGFLDQVPEFESNATVRSSLVKDIYDWEAVALAEEYISRLELSQLDRDTPIKSLSGGWRKRVALARELVKKPDLLLMDEPTNHIDVESILWLEDFLSTQNFATLTITHDRMFLQRVANRIVELNSRHAGGLLNVKGDYLSYLEIRDQLLSAQERREVILKNTLRRETEWLRQGAKARTTKQQARIKRAGELKDEVNQLAQRNDVRTAKLQFHGAEKNPEKLIEARDLGKNYGDRKLFSKLNLLITPKTRLGLIGQNGSGKTSLIKVLLGKEESSSGTVIHSDHLKVAYFDQTRETLNPEESVLKTLCPAGDTVSFAGNQIHIRSYLDRFLFSGSQMDMAVGRLSGGEQSRLLIAKLMLSRANLLILDEPTNDLDFATLAVLEECLRDFDGAVILVTHDRYFLDQVSNQLLAFPPPGSEGGKLESFASMMQWEDWFLACKAKKEASLPEKTA